MYLFLPLIIYKGIRFFNVHSSYNPFYFPSSVFTHLHRHTGILLFYFTIPYIMPTNQIDRIGKRTMNIR